MDNKEEDKEFVESRSGVMDQMEVAPVEGAGVEETKVSDPYQAEPPLGDEDERGGESTTNGNQRRGRGRRGTRGQFGLEE